MPPSTYDANFARVDQFFERAEGGHFADGDRDVMKESVSILAAEDPNRAQIYTSVLETLDKNDIAKARSTLDLAVDARDVETFKSIFDKSPSKGDAIFEKLDQVTRDKFNALAASAQKFFDGLVNKSDAEPSPEQSQNIKGRLEVMALFDKPREKMYQAADKAFDERRYADASTSLSAANGARQIADSDRSDAKEILQALSNARSSDGRDTALGNAGWTTRFVSEPGSNKVDVVFVKLDDAVNTKNERILTAEQIGLQGDLNPREIFRRHAAGEYGLTDTEREAFNLTSTKDTDRSLKSMPFAYRQREAIVHGVDRGLFAELAAADRDPLQGKLMINGSDGKQRQTTFTALYQDFAQKERQDAYSLALGSAKPPTHEQIFSRIQAETGVDLVERLQKTAPDQVMRMEAAERVAALTMSHQQRLLMEGVEPTQDRVAALLKEDGIVLKSTPTTGPDGKSRKDFTFTVTTASGRELTISDKEAGFDREKDPALDLSLQFGAADQAAHNAKVKRVVAATIPRGNNISIDKWKSLEKEGFSIVSREVKVVGHDGQPIIRNTIGIREKSSGRVTAFGDIGLGHDYEDRRRDGSHVGDRQYREPTAKEWAGNMRDLFAAAFSEAIFQKHGEYLRVKEHIEKPIRADKPVYFDQGRDR